MPSAIDDTDTSHQHGSLCDRTNDLPPEGDSIPPHPLGLKPLGNKFLFTGRNARESIGTWALLPDEVIMLLLEQFCPSALLTLGHTCKFFYAFCHSDELWKPLFLQ